MIGKTFFLLIGLAYAASNAVPAKRQTVQKITDGNFDDVPFNCELESDVTCGGWTVAGSGSFDENEYQNQFALVYTGRRGETGTVSQGITGLSNAAYTLSYEYSLPYNLKPTPCTLRVRLGTQLLDKVSLPTGFGSAEDYQTRTRTFTPAATSGTLTFQTNCRGIGNFEWDLFDVSLTGPS